ncbi:alpha/beta fold hydrolase [Deinococcus detaillensis]|uniref:Alpha/beta fold hydrolase n=1 Tax=Deinococcus detaillensis TaxID=2592048 RepID=A0A553V2P3_9DEIO|nr:alpha/beta fold hydrolase [Deinococcus detaillensis]TSA86692.1 alpha/beta fold hydrolase [Deinococcus detaillensis]
METFASFKVGGQKIYGMVHLPEPDLTGTPRPQHGFAGVVILHGFTGNRGGDHRLLPLLSRYLAERGIASLRFDFRGSGESEGDFSEMTVSREVEDAVAMVEYFKDLPEIDPERVMLLGFSMGGLVAALTAPQVRPHRLALWAPALPELWLKMLPGGFVPPAIMDQGGWPIGREFFLEMPRLNPLKAAGQFGGQARVFHGDADKTCPPEYGVRYAEALGCDCIAIPNGTHTFESLESTETLYKATAAFLLGE